MIWANMPVSGLSGLTCLFGLGRGGGGGGGGVFLGGNITRILRKLTSWGSFFFAQLCRLQANTTFLNTSKGLIFLRRSEAVVPGCSSK